MKRKGKEIVHSISLSKIIRFGKVIRPAVASVELFELDVERMEWGDIVHHAVPFNVEKEPFGHGAFRAAFKTTSCNANFKDNVWVFKKYSNPEDDIKLIGGSVECHAKKQVQICINWHKS